MKKMNQGEKERLADGKGVLMDLWEKGERGLQGRDQASRDRIGDHASGLHTIFPNFVSLLASCWAALAV